MQLKILIPIFFPPFRFSCAWQGFEWKFLNFHIKREKKPLKLFNFVNNNSDEEGATDMFESLFHVLMRLAI
jgi:hypothetical protein